MKAKELKEGLVLEPEESARDSRRRVVALFGDLVAYSTGGDRLYHCKRRSFCQWQKQTKAHEVDRMEASL